MSAREWHTLASFGLLTFALALVNGQWALYMVGVAAAVVIVKHGDVIAKVL